MMDKVQKYNLFNQYPVLFTEIYTLHIIPFSPKLTNPHQCTVLLHYNKSGKVCTRIWSTHFFMCALHNFAHITGIYIHLLQYKPIYFFLYFIKDLPHWETFKINVVNLIKIHVLCHIPVLCNMSFM